MAQGKARSTDEVLKVLKPFFQLGCSVTKACEYAGIPRTTVQTWLDNDEILRLKVTAWQHEMSVTARRNWQSKLARGDYNASSEWLSKKEKDEFSDRKELTGADGDPLFDVQAKDKSDKAVSEFLGAGDTGQGE